MIRIACPFVDGVVNILRGPVAGSGGDGPRRRIRAGLRKSGSRRSERLGHHVCQPGAERIVTAVAVRMDERCR